MKKLVAPFFTVGILLFCLSGCDQARQPSADFSVESAAGIAPLPVTFNNLSSGGGPFAIQWEWDFGDGSEVSSEKAPTHTYTAPGSYDVTLRMGTWLGKTQTTKPAAVVVSGVGPMAVFSATPLTGTAPMEVQFTDASAAGHDAITGWAWDFGDQATSTEQNPRHTYTVPGGYTVKLTVTAGTATNMAVRAGYILVSPTPVHTPAMSRTFSGAYYVPGGTLDVTLALDYPAADITALGITEQIPADWVFQGVVGGTTPSLARINPDTGALELLYVTIPAFPFGVTYRLLVPAAAAGVQSFSGKVLYRTDGPQLETSDVVSTIGTQPDGEGEGEGEGSVYRFDYSASDHGWVAGFADLPADFDADYWGLVSGLRPVPVYTFTAADALYISGKNYDDDLFMYFKRRVTGLEPNTTYRVTFQADFFSNYRAGSVGAGGSPADSVYLKAGATAGEPRTVVEGEDWLTMNIDKGNQATGGADAVVLGTIGKPDDGTDFYAPLSRQSTEAFTMTTDAEGGAWLFFGTDSGYEGTTSLYYTAFTASFSPYVPPPPAHNTLLSLKRTVSTEDGYTPGQTMEVTLHVDRVGNEPIASLACMETLPNGWAFDALVSGPLPESLPSPGEGTPQFIWTSSVPRSPFTLTYRVIVPEGQTGLKDISGFLTYDSGTGPTASNIELTRLRPVAGNDTFISLTRQTSPLGIYFPGGLADVTLRFEKHGDQTLYGLVGTETIPSGWTIQGVEGPSPPPIWKVLSNGGGVEFGWVSVPTFPVEFTYHITPPFDASGVVAFSGAGLYRFSGPQLETNTAQTYLSQGYPIR